MQVTNGFEFSTRSKRLHRYGTTNKQHANQTDTNSASIALVKRLVQERRKGDVTYATS
jgi:hypothetical protein